MPAISGTAPGLRYAPRWLAATAVVISVLGPASATAGPAPSERTWVVSYLCRPPADISPWASEPGADSAACEWRIHDPASGRDDVFMTLPGTPSHISWTPGFTAVEFQIGDRLVRSEWRIGARPVELSRLPPHPVFSDIWSDSSASRWFAEAIAPVRREQRGANTFEFCATTLWERRAGDRAWRSVACETTVCDDVPERVRRAAERYPRARSLRLGALVDSMRIGYHDHRCVIGCDGDPGEKEQTVSIPVRYGDTLGLEAGYTFGDSEHAMAPLVRVNRRTGRRTTIYPRGEAGLFDQIGFRERGRFLLAGAESEGSHWRVVDLMTGERRFLGPTGSAAAVWVLAPR